MLARVSFLPPHPSCELSNTTPPTLQGFVCFKKLFSGEEGGKDLGVFIGIENSGGVATGHVWFQIAEKGKGFNHVSVSS